jgi:SAM-dependent methyltransferase
MVENNLYQEAFYQDRDKRTLHAAKSVLNLVQKTVDIRSAIDVGCGVGTWLATLGIEDVVGIDGPWVDVKHRKIARFIAHDFASDGVPKIDMTFDLAICLEVAEHMPREKAYQFVDFLCSLSETVLFSAAIPNQGGQGHVNEQWPDYWIEKFQNNGYLLYDFIRPSIWEDRRIPYWYRQNILLFSKTPLKIEWQSFHGKSLVHPDHYLERTNIYLRQAFNQFVAVLKATLKRKLL